MPVINPCHTVDIDLLEYVPRELITADKLVDVTELLTQMLIDADLGPLAIACGTYLPTINIVFRTQFEAIRADDLIDGWLSKLGAGLTAGMEAIRKAVDEKKGGKTTPPTSSAGREFPPSDDSGLGWLIEG